MTLSILKKEDVTYNEDDPINTGVDLDKIIHEEDKRIEEEYGLMERDRKLVLVQESLALLTQR